jgi:hypothetical protein
MKIKSLLFFLLLPLAAFAQKRSAARDFIRQEKIQEAIIEYSQLAPKASGDSEILLEYAYALALGGITENALMYLDRANLLGSNKFFNFYARQVFALCGQDSLAAGFSSKAADAPQWIASQADSLQRKYKQCFCRFKAGYPNADSTYLRANDLAAKGLFCQSLALYQTVKETVVGHSNEFLPYISSSVVWEQLKSYGKAAADLSHGLELMRADSTAVQDTETVGAFEEHLKMLQTSTAEKTAPSVKKYQTMLYAGGTFAKAYTAFNSRFGVFLTNALNAGVDLGVSGYDGSYNFNAGLSAYGRYRALIGGAGLTYTKYSEDFSLYYRLIAGFSILGKSGNNSTDIYFTFDIPYKAGVPNTYGISIGKSFYFGKRR